MVGIREGDDPLSVLARGGEYAVDVLGSSTKWVVAGSVALSLSVRSDSETLVWVLGSLLNAAFSKVLKKSINECRPDGSRLQDPGMPSSHAMSLFFLGTYLVLALQEYGVDSDIGMGFLWPLGQVETQASIAAYAVTASLWRVKAGLHSLPQIGVGAAVGAADAALWYTIFRRGVVQQVEALFGGGHVPEAVVLGVVCLTSAVKLGDNRLWSRKPVREAPGEGEVIGKRRGR
ncbi:unnamed protein product [Discosporangium mesarthrocarpum]